jgi:RHS repeat-associated protein
LCFCVKDHLGSTRAVVDEAGDVVEAYDYYPFGLQSRSYKEKGDPLTKETFTGKEQDTESNLQYFGARYYDAGAGRWLSVDPLADLNPSKNPYHYASNNPISRFDPDGNNDGDFLDRLVTAVQNNAKVSVGTGLGVGASLEVPGVVSVSAEATAVEVQLSIDGNGTLELQGTVGKVGGSASIAGQSVVEGDIVLAEGSVNSEGKTEARVASADGRVRSKVGTSNSNNQVKGKVKITKGKVRLDKRYKKNGNFSFSVKAGVFNIALSLDVENLLYELLPEESEDDEQSETEEDETDPNG